MPIQIKFIKLMKSEPKIQKKKNAWIIDEKKFLSKDEVIKLWEFSKIQKNQALENERFSPVRNWFMLELGLNAGLRVSEMASLTHEDLLINGTMSSIVVVGKGNKKRAVWISSGFKEKCIAYINYKKKFGYRDKPTISRAGLAPAGELRLRGAPRCCGTNKNV